MLAILPGWFRHNFFESCVNNKSRRWKIPKVKHPEGETSRRCNIQKLRPPKFQLPNQGETSKDETREGVTSLSPNKVLLITFSWIFNHQMTFILPCSLSKVLLIDFCILSLSNSRRRGSWKNNYDTKLIRNRRSKAPSFSFSFSINWSLPFASKKAYGSLCKAESTAGPIEPENGLGTENGKLLYQNYRNIRYGLGHFQILCVHNIRKFLKMSHLN